MQINSRTSAAYQKASIISCYKNLYDLQAPFGNMTHNAVYWL